MRQKIDMDETEAQGTRATGILSAVLLCLSLALAMVYGPQLDAAPDVSAAAQSTSDAANDPDQHTAPVTPTRPFVVVDWRVATVAALHDDGNSKPALQPSGIVVPEPVFAKPRYALFFQADRRSSVPGYGARAPPASS